MALKHTASSIFQKVAGILPPAQALMKSRNKSIGEELDHFESQMLEQMRNNAAVRQNIIPAEEYLVRQASEAANIALHASFFLDDALRAFKKLPAYRQNLLYTGALEKGRVYSGLHNCPQLLSALNEEAKYFTDALAQELQEPLQGVENLCELELAYSQITVKGGYHERREQLIKSKLSQDQQAMYRDLRALSNFTKHVEEYEAAVAELTRYGVEKECKHIIDGFLDNNLYAQKFMTLMHNLRDRTGPSLSLY